MLLPPEFDLDFYRETYPDLEGFSAERLLEHFLVHGRKEGRFGSAYITRARFLELLSDEDSTLEIGPFHAPAVSGPNVKYFDVLNKDELIELGKSVGHDVSEVPEIDYVSPHGDLSGVSETFDAVFSSHCIEHQPSLVRHLQQVHDVLKPGGHYFLIIPDSRYCFDHFRPHSTVADVIDANDDRRVHSLKNLIEHRSHCTHNDPTRHWMGDHGAPGEGAQRIDLIKGALNEHSPNDYIPDVHAWKFVPESFRQIMQDLVSLGLSNLYAERVYNTALRSHEFCAVLTRRPASKVLPLTAQQP